MLVSVEGPAVPSQAWRRYTSPALWPGWAPQITRVEASGDPITAGCRGIVHGPVLVRVPFRVLDVDPVSRQWSWWVGLGPVGVRMDHGVDEIPGGARVWVRLHAPTALAFPYRPIARLALRRLAAG